MSTATTSFYVTGGTLRHDAPSYVERQADRDLYEGLSRSEFCYVLTARQMGKSSLMARTATRLRQEGVTVLSLDLTAIGQNLSPEQWYDGLLSLVGWQLELDEELEAYWQTNARLGPLQRWMGALRHIVLPHCPGRVIVAVDEIDAVRSLPFSTDEFFAAVRECYNRRSEDAELQRLTFCLLGVASPSDLIQDTRTTPFNIGRRIELTDFTRAEAASLAAGLGRKESLATVLLERILYWTGGHPYLTQRLCQVVAEDAGMTDAAEVDRWCEELFLSPRAQERDDNLLFVRDRLLRREADLAGLLDLYAQVRRGKRVPADETNPLVSLLRLAGITRAAGTREAGRGSLRVRNRIYARVFDREWVQAHMPDAEVRRQRAAYRRGVLRATTIAAVLLAMIAALALTALSQAHRADRNFQRANASARQALLASVRAQRLAADRQVALKEREQQRDRANQERDRANREAQAARLAQGTTEIERQSADANARRARLNEHRANLETDRARRAATREAQQRRVADQERRVAEEQRQRAQAGQVTLRRHLYAARMNLAQQAWEAGHVERAVELLEAQRPRPGQEDLRGFEWRYLWRLCQGDARFTLRGHTGPVGPVVFSPDGRTLASGSEDHTVRLWDTVSQRALAALSGHAEPVTTLAFSPDGRTLASGSQDRSVRLWDVPTQREVAALPGHASWVTAMAFSADGRTLVSVGLEGTLKLWDIPGRRLIATLRGDRGGIFTVAVSPDGNLAATGGRENRVRLWSITAREEVASLPGHTGHIETVAFSPDGKLLASGGQDNTVKLWDLQRKQEVAVLEAHPGVVSSVAFSPDGKLLATGSQDSTVKLWDVATCRDVATLRGHRSDVWSVAFSPDGRALASGSRDGTVKVWDVVPRSQATILTGHTDWIHGLAFSPDGKTLASASVDKSVRLWDVAGQRELATLWHRAGVGSVAFSPDGKLLASDGGGVRMWDARLRHEVDPIKSGGAHVVFSPDGKRLAVGSGRSVRLWDVATREAVATLKGLNYAVWSIVFSPDGRSLAAGGLDTSHTDRGEVKLWDLLSGRVVATLAGSPYANGLAFSPDGKILACADLIKTITLWDVGSRRRLALLKGHTGGIQGLAFSPDGKTLASGGGDRTVKLWNMATKEEIATLRGHTGPITGVAFSPDGSLLATVSGDKTVRLWRAASFAETDAPAGARLRRSSR